MLPKDYLFKNMFHMHCQTSLLFNNFKHSTFSKGFVSLSLFFLATAVIVLPIELVKLLLFFSLTELSTYSKTCVKWPLKNRQNKVLMTNGSLMKVESIAECYNTFNLH